MKPKPEVMTLPNPSHTPVLVEEVLHLLQPKPGDVLLDATLGQGGHAAAYLNATAPDGKVVGLDADAQALTQAKENLAKVGERVQFLNQNFASLKDSLTGGGILLSPPSGGVPSRFSHILFDLGLGSHQLADESRGFSFASPGPLVMAYGELKQLPLSQLQSLNWLEKKLGYPPDAADVIQFLSEEELSELIRHYGEERYASRIARALKRIPPLANAKTFAQVIAAALPTYYERGRIHPATRTFQALRLAVNRELEALQAALPQAVGLLHPGGVLAVISFHSLEDRIVKNFFRDHKDALEILTIKPITATDEEISRNPRSRSAKLRAVRKRM